MSWIHIGGGGEGWIEKHSSPTDSSTHLFLCLLVAPFLYWSILLMCYLSKSIDNLLWCPTVHFTNDQYCHDDIQRKRSWSLAMQQWPIWMQFSAAKSTYHMRTSCHILAWFGPHFRENLPYLVKVWHPMISACQADRGLFRGKERMGSRNGWS
jgi:hypothetical protein